MRAKKSGEQSGKKEDEQTTVKKKVLLIFEKKLSDEIDAAAEVIGMTRADFIREAAEAVAKIPEEDLKKLRDNARESGVTLSGIIREAIQPYATAGEIVLGVDAPSSPVILTLLRQRLAEKRGTKVKTK